MVDRGLAGGSKGSTIEAGQLQQMREDSALAVGVRAIFAKNNAAVDPIAIVVVQDGKELDQVASMFDGSGQTIVQQAAPAKSLDAKTIKSTAAVEKPTGATVVHDEGQGVDASGVRAVLKKSGEQHVTADTEEGIGIGAVHEAEEQTHKYNLKAADLLKSDPQARSKMRGWSVVNHTQFSPSKKKVPVHKSQVNDSKNITVATSNTRQSVAAHKQVTDALNSGSQGVQQSKGGDFTVVNRSNLSPNKKNPRGPTNQVIDVNNLRCSNSFDVLMNESVERDGEKKVQQVDHDLASKTKLSNSPSSGKQQQFMKNADARSKSLKDLALVPVDEQITGAVSNAASKMNL
ncbi:hypothetical protein A4A49_18464, partial [Nicotiana attenuata]